MRQRILSERCGISDLGEVSSTSVDFLELFDERIGLLRKDLTDPCRFFGGDGDSADC